MISAKMNPACRTSRSEYIFLCISHPIPVDFSKPALVLTQNTRLGLHSAFLHRFEPFPLLRLVENSAQFFSRLAVARYMKLDANA